MYPSAASPCLVLCTRPVGPTLLRYHGSGDFVVAVDGGCVQAASLGLGVDLAVGDFDSAAPPANAREIIRLPREKDDTDLMFALKLCLARGFRTFHILGALGGRFDHSIAALHAVLHLAQNGARGLLADETCEVHCLAPGTHTFSARPDAYFSLFPAGGAAHGVTLAGLQYPLHNAALIPGDPIGTSNEFTAQTATVTFTEGFLYAVLADKTA